MRNLLQFIVRHSNFLLLLVLEVVAFWLMVGKQPFHQAAFLTSANQFVGGVNSMTSDVASYFSLHAQNELLLEENAALRDRIEELENRIEPLQEDSDIYRYAHLQHRYIPALVVDMTTHSPHNHLTLNKGRRDGVMPGMGVICSEGLVGIVSTVNERFALVVPVIHTKTRISCRVLPAEYTCFTSWDGVGTHYVDLVDVARHVTVNVGDTVVTSGMAGIFGERIPVGVIEKAELADHDSYYRIRIRLATDFRKLRYVQIIANDTQQEMEDIQHASL
jgi:rod shape-determining protein MreC